MTRADKARLQDILDLLKLKVYPDRLEVVWVCERLAQCDEEVRKLKAQLKDPR
jgi:hypothetical protein